MYRSVPDERSAGAERAARRCIFRSMTFQSPEVPEITPTELKAKLDAGDVPVLVDVREPFERSIADLPPVGQHRIPTGEFAGRTADLDPESEIVVYCRSGSRSAWAVAVLQQQGFERVYNLQGGVLGWRSHVDPTLSAY
jgi:adenylyltransferase/sulfurtransferase